MCNCNSSFCAVCCRRVKAYRFDNVPEITGDLQLYTEFYKVGEAYGHWKFTIDDLEAYLDIPTVLWQDKLVAFGHTATGGLFYQSDFRFDYTTSSFTIGSRLAGVEGQYSANIGIANIITSDYSVSVGTDNDLNGGIVSAFGSENIGTGVNVNVFGNLNSFTGNYVNIFGVSNIADASVSNLFGYGLNTNGFSGNAMFSDATGGSVAIAQDAFTAQFAGGYRFRLDASSTAVNISSTGIVSIDNVVNNNTETQLLVWNVTTKEVEYREVSSLPGGGGGSGTVTSVGMTITGSTALSVAGSPITTSGTFAVTWTGNNTQYVRGDGTLATFPTLTSGTVTDVNSGAGMDFTNFTTSGTIILGTPSSITLASTNAATGTTHSHEFDLGGLSTEYLAGDNTLQTFPTIPTVTPSALTKTDDTNVTLMLGGSHATALLQATSITVGWTGTLGVARGGSGAGTFTAGYLKANGTSAFTTVGKIPYSDISGAPSLYWIRDGASNRITLINNSDVVCLNTSFGFGMLNIGDVGYIPNTWQANLTILQTDTYGIDKGSSISFLPAAGGSFSGAGKFGFYKENATLYNQDTYFAISTRTGASNVTVDSIKLQISGAGLVNITNIPTGSSSNNILTSNGGTIEQRLVSSLPFTNNIGTVTNFSAHDLTTGYAYPLFTVNVTNPTTIPDLTFSLPSLPQKFVFAAPWGVTGTPLWRQLLPSDLSQDGATSGQVITWNGSSWVPQNAAGGGVTSVSAGNGMNFTTITTTGAVTMGAPQNVTLSSTSGFPSSTTHSHAFVPGGTSAQYIRGDGVLATLPTYTSGAGISVVSGVITNTLPSKWKIVGALYLTPDNSAYDIATPITGSIGYVTMTKGTASQCGYFEVRTAAAARVGYIGYQTGYMNYSSDIGNHRFNGGTVQINNIPSGSTSLNILTTNGGVVETRTIASLTGLPSSVWYLQGGTTASTNTSQNIYRTGDVWLNTGSTGAGGYKFRVTGDSYFEAQQYFAYATYQVWRNSANNAWLNGIRYNTSNQLELGQSSFDIYLPGYTSSRSVDTKTLLDKTLFVNSSGVVKSESSEWVRNDGASCWITSTESHLADNTNRRVTFDVSASTSNTYYTFSYSSGDYKMFFPGSYSQHLVICTLEYTTSGTPTVTATLRKTSTVVETNISTSADGRKVMTIHAIMSGTSSDYPTLYIYNATGGASITLQKCKITMIPLGETPP